ncbi:MAG: aminoacyl-histidine dipeptidase [Caulobacteraceae bacterium]
MNRLTQSKYSEIFRYFGEISSIPRCSGSEKQISDYLVSFAKKHNLAVIQDEALNVIIRKPAFRGYEKAPTVIIQGHMDMVCEKNKSTKHDFAKDPIKLRVVEDMIYAEDTTLGADNGIALAYALTLLASKDLPHPALEALFTVDEESTMSGAKRLDTALLKGRLLVNLDSEEEGKLLVSSAGGTKAKVVLPIEWDKAPAGTEAYRISIGGLKGGHSGMEINKYRGNANKLLGRLLDDLSKECSFSIADVVGGLKSNAVPRESEVVILVDTVNKKKVESKIAEWEAIFKNELRVQDPGVQVCFENVIEKVEKVFSKDTAAKLIAALVLTPNGVQSMSMEIDGLVESSTNLGIVAVNGDEIWMVNEMRSSVRTLKRGIFNTVSKLAETLNGKVIVESDYPEWAYNPDSKLRPLFIKVYKEKYKTEPEIIAIHAGLECGVFMSKTPGLDAISLGPDTFDVHSPNEHVSIPSVERTWEYLLEVMKHMNELK